MQFLGQRLEGVAYRLVKEVGCICFTLNTGDEGCFGAGQGGPVQALEPAAAACPPSPCTRERCPHPLARSAACPEYG